MSDAQVSLMQDVDLIKDIDPLKDQILLAKEAANLAVELTQQGNIQESIANYRKAIELNPKSSVWIYKALGNQMLKSDQIDEAVEILTQATGRFPESAELYMILAACFQKQGNVDSAIKNYCQAISLESNLPIWVFRELANQLAAKLNSLPLEMN